MLLSITSSTARGSSVPEETTTSRSVSQIRWMSVLSLSSLGYSEKMGEDFVF